MAGNRLILSVARVEKLPRDPRAVDTAKNDHRVVSDVVDQRVVGEAFDVPSPHFALRRMPGSKTWPGKRAGPADDGGECASEGIVKTKRLLGTCFRDVVGDFVDVGPNDRLDHEVIRLHAVWRFAWRSWKPSFRSRTRSMGVVLTPTPEA